MSQYDVYKKVERLVDSNESTEALLKGLKELADVCKYEEAQTWVADELGGYPPGKDVPQYRLLPVEILGQCQLFGKELEPERPLPTSVIINHFASEDKPHEYRDSVAALNSQIASSQVYEFKKLQDLDVLNANAPEGSYAVYSPRVVAKTQQLIQLNQDIRNKAQYFFKGIVSRHPEVTKRSCWGILTRILKWMCANTICRVVFVLIVVLMLLRLGLVKWIPPSIMDDIPPALCELLGAKNAETNTVAPTEVEVGEKSLGVNPGNVSTNSVQGVAK
jgi:hypothetical protein